MGVAKNPELMVIGDSLAQGCRSLSVAERLCGQSYGARIGQVQGWPFVSPDHVRPVVFDLEELIRKASLILGPVTGMLVIKGIRAALRNNALDWHRDFTAGERLSGHDGFDNLGIAGAKIPDLLERTYASSLAEVEKVLQGGGLDGSLKEILATAARLHVPINSCFTLNPSQQPAYKDFSPMRWVEERRPKRLLVQIGHNHGLFDVGFSASRKLITYGCLEKIEDLALRLAELPREVGEIYYFLLPKVSAVANLVPTGEIRDGYAEEYRPAFNPVAGEPFTGDELRQIDQSIRDTNNQIRERFRTIFNQVRPDNAQRLWFIDAYELFHKYDFKNSGGNQEKQILAGKQRINNQRLNGKQVYIGPRHRRRPHGTKLLHGGFQSADGMHPSGVGYAVLASEVMHFMGLPHDPAALLAEAFAEEPLLKRYPLTLDNIYDLIRVVQGLRPEAAGAGAAEKDRIELQDLVCLAQQSLRIG